jgi:DegV family protein with EDD domain
MPVKIVTESTCDLPAAIIKQYDITVVPLFIHFGAKDYRDGVDISREEFYQRLPKSFPLPTTAAPGPTAFKQVYEQLAREGATEILSIHISASLSATLESARTGAHETTVVPVTAIDSKQLSLGTGFMVEAAAKAAQAGQSKLDILKLIDDLAARTHVFAALDTLEYLRRSGRMNGLIAGVGTLLQLKPILTMFNGQAGAERVRTHKRSIGRLVEMMLTAAPLERVAFVHTHAADRIAELRQPVQALLPATDIWSMDITPVIGTHIGPGAVGFVCISAVK